MSRALPKPKYPAARIGMPGEQAYTASEVEQAVSEALQSAYDAMFDIKGCKVTRFDAQTAIRKLKEAHAQASPVAPASEGEDAARYRWLRDRLPGSTYRIEGVIYSEGGEGVDAAVDAARTASLGRVG